MFKLFKGKKNKPVEPATMREAREQDWSITNELYEWYGADTPILFKKNNCGTNWITCKLASIVQKAVGVNFDIACWFHDEEWRQPTKSYRHKITSNANLEYNLLRSMITGVTVNRMRVASWFHGLVSVNLSHYSNGVDITQSAKK